MSSGPSLCRGLVMPTVGARVEAAAVVRAGIVVMAVGMMMVLVILVRLAGVSWVDAEESRQRRGGIMVPAGARSSKFRQEEKSAKGA